MRAVDKVADSPMNFMIGKMMVSQSVPEIMQITKKHGAHEDFNPNVKDNHDRIDFGAEMGSHPHQARQDALL